MTVATPLPQTSSPTGMVARLFPATNVDSQGVSFSSEFNELTAEFADDSPRQAAGSRNCTAHKASEPRRELTAAGHTSRDASESAETERSGAPQPQSSSDAPAAAVAAEKTQEAAETATTGQATADPQACDSPETPAPATVTQGGSTAVADQADPAAALTTIERTSLQLQSAASLAFAVRLTQAQAGAAPAGVPAAAAGEANATGGQAGASATQQDGAAGVRADDAVSVEIPAVHSAAAADGKADGAGTHGRPAAKSNTAGQDGQPAAASETGESAKKTLREMATGLAAPAGSQSTAPARTAERSTVSPVEAVSTVAGVEPTTPGPAANRIDLRFQNGQGETVDIRLISQRDAVQVAVRTAATGLANELRDGLQDLVQTLKDTGCQTETWRPAVSSASSSAGMRSGTETEQNSAQAGGGNARQDTPGGQQDNKGGNGRGGRPLPVWVEEFEAGLAGRPEVNWRDILDGNNR